MIAIDVFCGAGGLSQGLINAGIKVAVGIDVNPDYRLTYESNNSPSTFLEKDIRATSAEDVQQYIHKNTNQLFLVGCAPCQPFSPHRKGFILSDEAKLLAEFGRLIKELQPCWVFIENVPGITKVPGYSTYRRFRKLLDDESYFHCEGILDAKRYGVPQTRRRFVMIASKVIQPTLPPATHGKDALPYRTVREAISHLPPIAAGGTCRTVSNHKAAAITPLNLKRLKKTPRDGGGRTDWSKSLRLKCHEGYEGHTDVYGRMKWDAPAPTLTCRCFSISNGRYGHPRQHRAMSLREAACLQSFPETFEFFGESQRSIGEQIGNAVPVSLAEAVGRHILKLARQAGKKKQATRRKRSSDG
jgi:DNA (cytosine-5)-methyltransferase 1